TIYERAEVGERVVDQVRKMLEKQPVEVLGHLDLAAVCCRAGTVAIVKLDLDQIVNPPGGER
ncbi:MAG: hypothetical protein ACRD2X_11680, partial [Vicinamibacteraceae bacterium]